MASKKSGWDSALVSMGRGRLGRTPRSRRRRPQKRFPGFSLVELLMALAILGTIVGIAIPTYGIYREKAKIAAATADIRILEREIAAFQFSNEQFPNTLAAIGRGGSADPWGTPYRYLKIAGADITEKGKMRKDRFLVPLNSDYDLYSEGYDQDSKPPLTAKASWDDIIRANDGAFVGPASDY